MRDAFEGNNLKVLADADMLWKTNPDQAVTFVANHDTDREPVIEERHKSQAYALILTHPGYPTIFYSDIENNQLKEELENLILIHRTLAVGDLQVLYADNDEYVALRKGNSVSPGLLVYLNTSENLVSRQVDTDWTTTFLADYTDNINGLVMTDDNGMATIFAPGNGYAIWSINDIENQ